MRNRDKLPDSFVVAIDGPAGSGKSTMAKLLAKELGCVSIDTGAMYRSVTAKAIDAGVSPADERAVAEIAGSTDIEFRRDGDIQKTFVDGVDFTERIREPDVNEHVSTVAANPAVRERMVAIQRRMGSRGRVVMEGRDIGSNVFPDARFKFFLVADDSVRAGRRLKEMEEAGRKATGDQVLENIRARDAKDSAREYAPLTKPDDAVEIDTSDLSVDSVLRKMIEIIFSSLGGDAQRA